MFLTLWMTLLSLSKSYEQRSMFNARKVPAYLLFTVMLHSCEFPASIHKVLNGVPYFICEK